MDRILMFSNGLDSFILKELYSFSNEECLFVDMNTTENVNEKRKIKRDFPGVIITEINLSKYMLPNNIIPFRNNILAFIAAQYSANIYFGFTIGDTTRDKDYVFAAQTEAQLNYFAQSSDKIAVDISLPYRIHMPFKEKTKEDLIRNYLKKKKGAEDKLLKFTSCYNGLSCGTCRSCIRNYIALTNNGIDCSTIFQHIPTTTELKLFLKESIEKKRNQSEINSILRCIEK